MSRFSWKLANLARRLASAASQVGVAMGDQVNVGRDVSISLGATEGPTTQVARTLTPHQRGVLGDLARGLPVFRCWGDELQHCLQELHQKGLIGSSNSLTPLGVKVENSAVGYERSEEKF